MAFKDTLHTNAVSALSPDNVANEHTKLKAILTLDASSGVFEAKYQFPRFFTQDERDALKAKLIADGLTITQSKATGFLLIQW